MKIFSKYFGPCVALILFCLSSCVKVDRKIKPNFIIIFADDLGYGDLGSYGHPTIKTPNLDRMVAEGQKWTQFYAGSSVCTPSRASFLTGRYPASTHAHRNGAEYFPDHEVLVTKILKDAGYDCGLIGKLHLSSAEGGVEKRTDDGYETFYYSHDSTPKLNPSIFNSLW